MRVGRGVRRAPASAAHLQARPSTPVACTAVPHTVPRTVAPSAPPPAAPLDGWGAGRCTTSASALGAEPGRVWAAEGAGESPRAHPPERRCACPVGVVSSPLVTCILLQAGYLHVSAWQDPLPCCSRSPPASWQLVRRCWSRGAPPARRAAVNYQLINVATCNVYTFTSWILTCLSWAGTTSLLLRLAPCKLAGRQSALESRCAAGAAPLLTTS